MIIYKLNTVPRYDSAVTIVHANEGEYGGQWVFEIVEGDSVFDVSGGYPEVTLNIMKPDGNVYSNIVPNGMNSNRRVIVDIAEQMTAYPGKAIAELIFVRSGTKKATANFIIEIERSPVDMGGQESESLINYVERNREAAEAATAAAYAAADATQNAIEAAQEAANSAEASANAASRAQRTAANALDNLQTSIQNIQNMPQTIQSLASTLATSGAPQHLLGFNSSGNAGAYDLGIVTPQMYGATGNDTTYDTPAFLSAIASGKRVVVPDGTYRLGGTIWADDSTVLYNAGTYSEGAVIVSRNIRDSAPVERFIKQFNASENGGAGSNTLIPHGACYDSERDRFIIIYSAVPEESEYEESDLILKAYDTDFHEITGSTKTYADIGYAGGICYNPNTDKLYIATGAVENQVIILDPVTYDIDDAWTVIDPEFDAGRVIRINYDDVNDLYYIAYKNATDTTIRVFDSEFNDELKRFSLLIDEVKETAGLHNGNDTLFLRGATLYEGQYLQLLASNSVIDSTHEVSAYKNSGAFICQYNYADGSLKKAHRITSNYLAEEDPKFLVNANGQILCLSYLSDSLTSGNNGKNYISVSQLVMDERIDGDCKGVYNDAKVLNPSLTDGVPDDLDDVLGVGCYIAPNVHYATGLENCPTSNPFVMWVIPVPETGESRAQIIVTQHGEVFTRAYVSQTSTWYGWRQLAEAPRKNATMTGTWDGGGFVTAGGTEVRFTIPMSLPTESGSMPTITITSLKVNARQGGNYLITTDTELATSADYTIVATPGAFGINVTVRKNAAFANVVNNEAVGIGASVTMRFS